MEPVHALQEFHPDLFMPHTVAHPQGRYTHCTLVNHSNHSIILPKFTAIGLATALFQPDVLYNSEDAFDDDFSGLDYSGMTSLLSQKQDSLILHLIFQIPLQIEQGSLNFSKHTAVYLLLTIASCVQQRWPLM